MEQEASVLSPSFRHLLFHQSLPPNRTVEKKCSSGLYKSMTGWQMPWPYVCNCSWKLGCLYIPLCLQLLRYVVICVQPSVIDLYRLWLMDIVLKLFACTVGHLHIEVPFASVKMQCTSMLCAQVLIFIVAMHHCTWFCCVCFFVFIYFFNYVQQPFLT